MNKRAMTTAFSFLAALVPTGMQAQTRTQTPPPPLRIQRPDPAKEKCVPGEGNLPVQFCFYSKGNPGELYIKLSDIESGMPEVTIKGEVRSSSGSRDSSISVIDGKGTDQNSSGKPIAKTVTFHLKTNGSSKDVTYRLMDIFNDPRPGDTYTLSVSAESEDGRLTAANDIKIEVN